MTAQSKERKLLQELRQRLGFIGETAWVSRIDYVLATPEQPSVRGAGEQKAWGRFHEDGRYITISVGDLKSQPTWIREKWTRAEPLYSAAASPQSVSWSEEKCEQCGKTTMLAAASAKAGFVSVPEPVLRKAVEHLQELRDAWQRGAINECDGQVGTRSNRNVDVEVALRDLLAAASEQRGGGRKQ